MGSGLGSGQNHRFRFRLGEHSWLLSLSLQGSLCRMRPFLSCCLRLSSASSLGRESRRKLTPLDSHHDVETLQASLLPPQGHGILQAYLPRSASPGRGPGQILSIRLRLDAQEFDNLVLNLVLNHPARGLLLTGAWSDHRSSPYQHTKA